MDEILTQENEMNESTNKIEVLLNEIKGLNEEIEELRNEIKELKELILMTQDAIDDMEDERKKEKEGVLKRFYFNNIHPFVKFFFFFYLIILVIGILGIYVPQGIELIKVIINSCTSTEVPPTPSS